jgi:hypothetical protein
MGAGGGQVFEWQAVIQRVHRAAASVHRRIVVSVEHLNELCLFDDRGDAAKLSGSIPAISHSLQI